MSIVRETLDNGLVRTHSNAGFYIHGGFPEADYSVAYDPVEAQREYVETNRKVEEETPDPSAPRTFSKFKLKLAIASKGYLDEFTSMLAEVEVAPGYNGAAAFADAVTLDEDHPKFKDAVKKAKDNLGLTDDDVERILAASVAG